MRSPYEIRACWIYDSQMKHRCNIQNENLGGSGGIDENASEKNSIKQISGCDPTAS